MVRMGVSSQRSASLGARRRLARSRAARRGLGRMNVGSKMPKEDSGEAYVTRAGKGLASLPIGG